MRRNYINRPISKTFNQAFPKFESEDTEKYLGFWDVWEVSPFKTEELTKEDLEIVYNNLNARYYSSNFIYMNDLEISLNVMRIVSEYYPNAKERINLVKQIRDMSVEEFKQSGIMIDSQGSNPKISTRMDELINLIDSQQASFQLKSQEQALKGKFIAMYDGVMQTFIDMFKEQFVTLYAGVVDYIYRNKLEDEDNDW